MTQEVAVLDLVGRMPLAGNGEIVTQDTFDERSQVVMLAATFDSGWRGGQEALRLEMQNEIRVARQRIRTEIDAEYRAHRRRFATTTIIVAALLFVMLVAVAYLGSMA